MKYIALLATLGLLGCGVDGPPSKPGAKTDQKGLSITGRAEFGYIKRSQ